ncbi:MAG TPA: hypothetical protein VN429_12085 [Methanospirillum sp.]|uniref:hypothetical protein n=1 Tax=Methanospirillum sp. TaxID=45200 RepID=UPI002B534019|nr:hypothetical protein [Methanospirillum sp.]HWQ65150.1 hypothetical protein [Methanospirillum sp.]
MKSTSNTKPDSITPDWGSLVSGKMDILVHWDISTKTGTDTLGSSYTYYEYQEERINIEVPNSDQTTIQTYINVNMDRYFRMVGALSPSDLQWKSDMEAAVLDLAGTSS